MLNAQQEKLKQIYSFVNLNKKEYKLIKCGHRDTTALPISQVFVEMYGQGIRNEFPRGLYSL